MSKLIVLPVAILLVSASIALTSCSSKPLDELKMAKTAMDQARSKEAPEYAPYDWDRARSDWDEANALIDMGRYREARNVLTLAVGNFNTARDTADRRLESLKIEVTALGTSAKKGLNNLEQAAESARVKPTIKKRIDGALPLIDEKVAVMNAALEQKEYLRARTAGKEALGWIHDLQESLGINH